MKAEANKGEQTDTEHDQWLEGLPTWVVALTRGLIGVTALGGGTALLFLGPQDMTTPQATVTSSLIAFGFGMLSSFFLGSLTFRRKSAIVATGSFALFLILFIFSRGKTLTCRP